MEREGEREREREREKKGERKKINGESFGRETGWNKDNNKKIK